MLINEYFHIIESQISDCINVVETRVTKDQRSLHIGIIEGELLFKDGSALYFVEFANVKVGVEIYKYSYQYQDRNSNLIFRYDMAPHHREISSFPHHKHIDPINVISSAQPSLLQVLAQLHHFKKKLVPENVFFGVFWQKKQGISRVGFGIDLI